MDNLNKGRCSRCLASKSVYLVFDFKADEKNKVKVTRGGYYLFCQKYNAFCADMAGFVCKEPPMGITAEEYKKLEIKKWVENQK